MMAERQLRGVPKPSAVRPGSRGRSTRWCRRWGRRTRTSGTSRPARWWPRSSPWLPVAQWVALGINPHALTAPPPERAAEEAEEEAAAAAAPVPTKWIVAGVLGTAVLAALIAAAVGR